MKFRDVANLFLKPLGERLDKVKPPQTGLTGADLMGDLAYLLAPVSRPVILDVGAHKGETARRLVKRFPQANIHSFEPHPDSFKTMRENVAPWPNITPVNVACGSASGRQKLFTNSASFTNSLLPNSDTISQFAPAHLVEKRGEVDITVKALDDYCAEQRLPLIHLLKMDAQGYERQIIDGASQLLANGKILIVHSEVLFVDLYQGQAYFHEIYDYFVNRGYGLVGIYDCGYNPEDWLVSADAIFARLDLSTRIKNTK